MVSTSTCKQCQDEFEYEHNPANIHQGREIFKPTICPRCIASNVQKEREAILRREWMKLCPPLYQTTDPSRLPQEQLEKVMAWKFGPIGLLLHGETGTGKTRAAFLAIKQLHRSGKTVSVFHGNTFAHECSKRFGEHEGEDWISKIAERDIVFIDDLGKFKLTERVEAELFGLIEIRIAYLRPVIITTNFISEALESKMTEDRGAPIVRRLREFCESVKF